MKSMQYIEELPDGKLKVRSRLTDEQIDHLFKLTRSASQCANFSLYSKEINTREVTYIASGTCNHKCCNICNWHRQKFLRRKFIKFFNENPTLYKIATNGGIKYVTKTQYHEKYEKNGKGLLMEEAPYDLMHLTLTVPHYAGSGFRGDLYYYSKIIELFNWLRKDKEWLNMVFGGEFGVETEREDNGLHIHIHSLLLVRRFRQNRNALHAFVIEKWNRLTVNEYSTRKEFTKQDRESIKKSNRTLIDDVFINRMNPKGATIIGLETIYAVDDNGRKVRNIEFGSEAMIFAVLETISYHFEPHAFDKENGRINIELLADLLPHVYKKILYKKFGCLHGEKSLNIAAEIDPEDMLQNMREAAAVECDEETGEIIAEREFYVLNPATVYHDGSADNKIILSKNAIKNSKPLNVQGSGDAVRKMSEMIMQHYKRGNKGESHNINNN